MSFLIYLHKNEFQPEDPQVLDGHLKPDTQLSFVDFIPSIIKRSSTSIISATEIEYHPFKKMIETANEWLKDNQEYNVINCETTKIMFKFNDNQNFYDLRFNDISHYIYGTEKNNLLKSLRVWIRRKEIVDGSETITVVDNLAANNNNNNSNLDAGYATDSISPDTPQQESPKLSSLSSVLKRRWTQPQQHLQKSPNKQAPTAATINAKVQIHAQKASNHPMNEYVHIHSTDHSPKKNAFQQQQAFRLQQYSSQSKFFLNKLQRQASCPQSNNAFQTNQNAQQQQQSTNWSAQNSPIYNLKQSHNHQGNSNQPTNQQPVGHHQQQIGQQQQQQQQQKSKANCSIKLNFVDVIPEFNEENEKFERLDSCLDRLNKLIRGGEIPGRILNVETGCVEASIKWKFDTQCSFNAISSKNVYFLRCFYLEDDHQQSSSENERIRIFDFVPERCSESGFFKRPKFENFSLLIPKITEWLVNNPTFKFKNAQTLDMKMKSYVGQNADELIDTKLMNYTEHGDYLRILRLVYSEPVTDEEKEALMNEQLISINRSITNLLDAQKIEDECDFLMLKKKADVVLIKQDSDTSGQSGSNDLSKSTNLDSNLLKNLSLDNESKQNREESTKNLDDNHKRTDCDSLVMKLRDFSNESKRQIYLTSKLFLCHRKGQTINDLKQEIQDWYKNCQSEMSSKGNNADLVGTAKPRILACETMQLFCKQNFMEMNKDNDFTYLQKASEETFMYNRFGSKNGYLVNVFRIYFDVGWFAWNRLGYAQKLGCAQKIRRKRFNYSTSFDDEHLKEPNTIASNIRAQRIMTRRESVGNFYQSKERQSNELEAKLIEQARRRRSCVENSFERSKSFRAKLSTDEDEIIVIEDKDLDKKSDKKSLDTHKCRLRERSFDKSNEKFNLSKDRLSVQDSLTVESSSDFCSLSMLANVSKLESSNSSLSSSVLSNNEGQFLKYHHHAHHDRLGANLKRKIKRFNTFRQQSIDNCSNNHDNVNCLLM